VGTIEEAIAALPRVIALDRRTIRQRFEQRFCVSRMAKDYVAVYRSLLALSHVVGANDDIKLPLTNGGDGMGQRLSIAHV
jgi:hypothetical protein